MTSSEGGILDGGVSVGLAWLAGEGLTGTWGAGLEPVGSWGIRIEWESKGRAWDLSDWNQPWRLSPSKGLLLLPGNRCVSACPPGWWHGP